VNKDKKPLSETHPELAKEANGWDPATVIAGTNKKLSWKCSLGHVWEVTGNKRITRGDGCPYCSNYRVLKGFNDLATTHPNLVSEVNGWDPSTVIAGTHEKRSWKCSLGHVWGTPVFYRKNGSGCPYCSNHLVLKGFNDLATTNPELAKEAYGWDPTTVTAGTNKKLSWKCSKSHIWQAIGSSRNSGNGCPYCVNQKVLKGFNDLAGL
jgi:DNA-directed RNA polymerase subunit RPC12/RpoP